MPHPDNTNWMSMLIGRRLEAPPRRLEIEDLVGSRDMWDLSHLNRDLPAGVDMNEGVEIRPGLTGELYTPRFAESPAPMLYLHGGGWCAGHAANERKIAMGFAAAGHVVLNLEYRLAPEHPFPAAVEDCVYAARWLSSRAGDLGARPGPIAAGGQSAGANLAAATVAALSAHGDGLLADLDGGDLEGTPVVFAALVLLSGIFSMPLLLAEPGSNVGPAELWHRAYLGNDFLRRNRHPLASPLLAPNLEHFPPSFVSCGDEDSLLGQSLAMTKALSLANVPTTLSVLAGLDHGLPFLADRFPSVAADLERMQRWLAAQTASTVSAAAADREGRRM